VAISPYRAADRTDHPIVCRNQPKGMVRTPRDGVNMHEGDGCLLWNLRKRISAVLWHEADLTELTDIVSSAELLAGMADEEWSSLEVVAAAAAPGVVEPMQEDVSVIRDSGPNPSGVADL
jgi:hypothetical protein